MEYGNAQLRNEKWKSLRPRRPSPEEKMEASAVWYLATECRWNFYDFRIDRRVRSIVFCLIIIQSKVKLRQPACDSLMTDNLHFFLFTSSSSWVRWWCVDQFESQTYNRSESSIASLNKVIIAWNSVDFTNSAERCMNVHSHRAFVKKCKSKPVSTHTTTFRGLLCVDGDR